MQEQSRPERLVEYLCTVGLSSPLIPLYKDGLSPSTPIHSLCLVYNKDEPPPQHAKLEQCYYGESANLNAGNPNFLSPSTFLCISRSPHAPPLVPDDDPTRPITDVIVVYPDRNERPPPGYINAPVVGGGGGKSSPYGKALLIAYSRGGKKPLLDLVLCSGGGGGGGAAAGMSGASPGAVPAPSALLSSISAPSPSAPHSPTPPFQVPPHYALVKKSVAMGAFHDSTFIAVLPTPSSLSSLLLRPVLLDRYPRVDLPSSPLPDSLPYFAFPEGAVVLPQTSPPPAPAVSTFVLTQPSGLLMHCASVVFYEPCTVAMDAGLLKGRRGSVIGTGMSSQLSLPAGSGVELGLEKGWAPKCLVLVSYYAYYRAFAVWLTRVLGLSVSGCPCPLERLVMNLWETPLPRPSHQAVQLRLPTVYAASSSSPSVAFTSSIAFPRPSSSSLPLTDFPFLPLFSRLSLSNVVLILTSMLNEKKIVLYSSSPALLTPISAALLSLLFPLQWTSPYVPVVPALSSGILDAPMPVFVGVDGRYALHRLTSTDDACVVDVDGDEVKVHGKYGAMGEAAVSQLKKELEAHAGLEAGREVRDGEFNEVACRACFLHLFVSLLGDVDESLLFPPISAESEPSFAELFDLPAFLAAPQRKGNRALLKALCSTQLFSHWIEEKTYSATADRRVDLLFFDDCCRYEAEHRQARANKAQHTPLIARITQQKDDTAVYVVPTPDTSDLAPSSSPTVLYRYPIWPPLDHAKMGRPRPVALKYLRDGLNETTASPAASSSSSSSSSSLPASPAQHSAVARTRPSALNSPVPSTPLSPEVYAKCFLRDVYAVWFELWSICLPVHPSPHSALLRVWRGLARMTAQGVDPDVGIFRSVLSICGRWRKKDVATLIFETMRKHGIKPSSLTYGAYTSALAESSNEAEMERERSKEKAEAANAATAQLNGVLSNGEQYASESQFESQLDSDYASSAAASADPADEAAAIATPIPRGLYLDPYRLAADKHKRLILRAQRQRVVWSSLSVSVTHTCAQCHYELSEGEVLSSWLPGQPSCPVCRHPFSPQLSVFTAIVTHPPRLKSLVFRHVLHRPLAAVHRRYHISVPLLSAAALRARFLSAALMFREDLMNVNVMRVMHHVVYWNLVYLLSQPHNGWDLTFLVDDSDRHAPDDRRRIRIRRHRKGEDSAAGEAAHGEGGVLTASEQTRGRNRQIRLSEGVRERQQGEADVLSPSELTSVRSPAGEEDEEEGREGTVPRSPTTSLSTTSSFSSGTVASTEGSTVRTAMSPSLSIDTELSSNASTASSLVISPPATSPPVVPSSSTSPFPALSTNPEDAAVEKELSQLLTRRQLQTALELFLKHRMRMRAQRAFSGRGGDSSATSTPRGRAQPSLASPPVMQAWPEGVEESPSNSKLLLVKKGSKAGSRASPHHSGASSMTASPSASFMDGSSQAVPPLLSGPQGAHLRSPSLSKSRSSNEVESLRASLASVTSLALTVLKSGKGELSPNPAPRPMQSSSSSDSALPLALWYPMRDAGPSVPLYRHSMFEVMHALGGRWWEAYERFCEDFDRAVEAVRGLYGDEVTAMDRAPRPEVRVVEVVLGVVRTKGRRDRREKSQDATKPQTAALKKKTSSVPSARAEDDVLRVSTPLVKSASIPLKPSSAPAAASTSVPPVSVTFPIAYPVGQSTAFGAAVLTSPPPPLTPLTPATPSSQSSPPSPTVPSTPPAPTRSPPIPASPFSPQYDAEVYSAPLSHFLAGTPNSRAASAGSTPSKEEQSGDDDLVELPTTVHEHSGGGEGGRRAARSLPTLPGTAIAGGSTSPTPPSPGLLGPGFVSPPPPSRKSSKGAEDALSMVRMSRASSQPDHPLPASAVAHPTAAPVSAANHARLAARSASTLTGSSTGAATSQKSFTQSLYHFLMTKPTAASAAAAGARGSSFTGGSRGSGAPQTARPKPAQEAVSGAAKKVLSSSSIDSSAKRREEKKEHGTTSR